MVSWSHGALLLVSCWRQSTPPPNDGTRPPRQNRRFWPGRQNQDGQNRRFWRPPPTEPLVLAPIPARTVGSGQRGRQNRQNSNILNATEWNSDIKGYILYSSVRIARCSRNTRSSVAQSRSWLEMAARAWPGAAAGSRWPLKPGPEPQLARNGRSSLAQSRSWLAKWPLEPGPAPQLARNGRSSVPRGRRMLDRCRSNLLRNREMLDWCPSSQRGSAECSTGAARACSGATACSKSAARAHCHEVRSLLAFEMTALRMLARDRLLSASSFSRFHLDSFMLCTGSH